MLSRRFIKIGIGTLIVVGAFSIAFFTIGQASRPEKLVIQNPEPPKPNPVESLASLTTPKENKLSPVKEEGEEENATEAVVKNIAASILEKNPNGPITTNGIRSIIGENPEALLEAAIADTLENFNYADWKTPVKDSEIKIGSSDSEAALSAYLTSLFETLQGTYRSKGIDFKNPSVMMFSQMRNALLSTIEKLKALPVPPSLVKIHKEEISLLSAQARAYREFTLVNEDPIKALLALQVLPNVDRELEVLKNEVTQFITVRNITL